MLGIILGDKMINKTDKLFSPYRFYYSGEKWTIKQVVKTNKTYKGILIKRLEEIMRGLFWIGWSHKAFLGEVTFEPRREL